MEKVYYAKIRDFKEWATIYSNSDGVIVDDAGEEISEDWIEKKYTFKEIFESLKTAVANITFEDSVMQEACQDFIKQSIEVLFN